MMDERDELVARLVSQFGTSLRAWMEGEADGLAHLMTAGVAVTGLYGMKERSPESAFTAIDLIGVLEGRADHIRETLHQVISPLRDMAPEDMDELEMYADQFLTRLVDAHAHSLKELAVQISEASDAE